MEYPSKPTCSLNGEVVIITSSERIFSEEEESTLIDNQPMATGYMISTAPAADLPAWFWSACPAASRRSPVHLRSSLHIHVGNVTQSDEIALATRGVGGSSAAQLLDAHHLLDSTATDDVLR